jgi:DNA-binding CsgD family transcriptional regulator
VLARKLHRLRPRDQMITLRLASGFTGSEIAAGLGVSPSIVSVALRRISARLGR